MQLINNTESLSQWKQARKARCYGSNWWQGYSYIKARLEKGKISWKRAISGEHLLSLYMWVRANNV